MNAQGDVVGLTNSSGDLVIEYVYDPWGSLLETKIGVDESNSKYSVYNNMALRNPLRYRGYIYERDTGFYYLQSRYYDPAIGRFINADTFVTTDITGILNANMFAYGENSPVNCGDHTGCAGYGMMSGWDPRENHYAKSAMSLDDLVLRAIAYSMEMYAGFGMGVGAGAKIEGFGLSAGYTYNVFEAYVEEGSAGLRTAVRGNVTVETPIYRLGIEKTEYRDLAQNIINSPDDWQVVSQCMPDTFLELSMYVGYGGSLRIGICWDKLTGYINEHKNEVQK